MVLEIPNHKGGVMDDKEYQEIKRRWDNKHSEINKLIAYVEELREENEILEAQKDGLREIVAKDDVLINKLKKEEKK